MKKILGLFLAVAVIAVVGCAKADEGDPNAATTGTTAPATTGAAATTTG